MLYVIVYEINGLRHEDSFMLSSFSECFDAVLEANVNNHVKIISCKRMREKPSKFTDEMYKALGLVYTSCIVNGSANYWLPIVTVADLEKLKLVEIDQVLKNVDVLAVILTELGERTFLKRQAEENSTNDVTPDLSKTFNDPDDALRALVDQLMFSDDDFGILPTSAAMNLASLRCVEIVNSAEGLYANYSDCWITRKGLMRACENLKSLLPDK